MNTRWIWLTLGGMFLLLSGCGRQGVFMDIKTLPNAIWNKDQIISFQVPVEDTTHWFNVWITVRNDPRYAYSNLWLFVQTTSPSGAFIHDTVDFRLADETGHWLGRGNNHKFVLEVPFKRGVRFPLPGTYHIEIQHGMRDVDLKAITDVGIRIEEIK